MDHLYATYPGRWEQIDELHALFANPTGEPYPDALYVQGGPSTGKTTIVTHLLRTLAIPHARVNLIECYTSKILLESILNQLAGHRISPDCTTPYAKCDNMMEFVQTLRKCDLTNGGGGVIVLDKADKLREMEFNLLPCFLRLRELTGRNLSVVMLSEIVFQKLQSGCRMIKEPLRIRFPQYTKEEILEILALEYDDKDQGLDLDFYRNYLNVFLSVFHRACRDLAELRYMARMNFTAYIAPITRGEVTSSDSMALWRNIAPVLKSSLEVLYLRLKTSSTSAFSKITLAQSIELPYYAKYLLIAAYLASYNPAKDDKRLFMKYHGKQTKTMRDVKAKSKIAEKLNTQIGPKPFSFDRLLAIFYAILDDKVGFNNNLLVQVSSLVELQLLSALSDNCNLDGQKYKCTVGFDFVQTISKMVGFNIRKYLSDFSHI